MSGILCARRPMPDTLKLMPHKSLTIRRSEPEVLEVEALYAPGGSPPPKHFHPEQDEHFEVLSGELRVHIDGEERTLRPAGDPARGARPAGRARAPEGLPPRVARLRAWLPRIP